MSKQLPSAPGFVMTPVNTHHGYPPIQQQPGYPGVQQPSYPAYPSAQPGYPQQPFPAPITQNNNNIQQQPTQWEAGNFMNHLVGATAFNVSQKVELLEAIIGWETGNKYSVKDQAGNKVCFVREETGCLSRICCGKWRPFHLAVKNNSGQEVMTFSRDLDCGFLCCGLCCQDEIKVTASNGQILGTIEEACHCLYPRFNIKNSSGQTVLKIEGPICVCGHVTFQVLDLNDVQVGSIKKEWGGIVRELLTDADNFSVTFPQNINPATKATLLGALFMIDFHYFERSGNEWGGEGGRRLFS